MFASIRFYFRFLILWLLYFSCLHPALPLVFYSTSLLLSYYIMCIPYLMSLAISLLAHVCLCTRHDFQCMFMIQILSIHVCLSLHATWHSPYYLLGSSDSPVSSCPGLGVWSLWILSVADQSSAAVVWIIDRLSRALSFQAPYAYLKFLFCKLVSAFCTIHTCLSPCILAIPLIGDVIFL